MTTFNFNCANCGKACRRCVTSGRNPPKYCNKKCGGIGKSTPVIVDAERSDLTPVRELQRIIIGKKVKRSARVFMCKCICGKMVKAKAADLTGYQKLSCGCRKHRAPNCALRTHGLTASPLHTRWSLMLRRCRAKGSQDYHYYGGRGIRVCRSWLGFANFHADMSPSFRPGLTLDRIDVNGNYEPSNCRWVSRERQSRNRTDTRYLTAFGETKGVADWADDPRCRVSVTGIILRIKRGMSVESAITTPRISLKGRMFSRKGNRSPAYRRKIQAIMERMK